MLTNLTIRDFAIVDKIDVDFGAGMTVLTGETGAGKSILVDALGLVLGERGKEAGGRPAFLVGLFSELWPDHLGGGQTQLVEKQADSGGIDDVLLHAASPVMPEPIRAS